MGNFKQRNYENENALIYIFKDRGCRVLQMSNKLINKNVSVQLEVAYELYKVPKEPAMATLLMWCVGFL